MAGLAGVRSRTRRRGARPLPADAHGRTGDPHRDPAALCDHHALPQHHSGDPRGAHAGRPVHGAAHPFADPLERGGHGDARQPAGPGPGRAHLHLRLLGDPLRHRLQLLLPGTHRGAWRRPAVHPGPDRAGGVRPRLPRRADQRGAAGQLPPGGGRQRPVLLPAPLADAGLLAVPHRVHGPRPDPGDLPGALHEVPGKPRLHPRRQAEGLVLPRRRRVRRTGGAGRHFPGRPREAGQPDLRGQLQPAAPGRPGARQRQDHPGTGRRVPWRRLERPQGHLGPLMGPAVRQGHRRPAAAAHGRGGRRRIPELQGQRRRLRPRAFLRQPRTQGDGQGPLRRGNLEAQPWWPRPVQGLCGLPPGGEPQGRAHRDPGQDGEGLWHRRRRGEEHRAQREEGGYRKPQAVPRPLRHPGARRPAGKPAVLPPGAGRPGIQVPAGAPRCAGRLHAEAAAGQLQRAGAAAGDPQGDPRRHRRPRDFHHHGLRAHPLAAGQGQGARPAHRADRARRGAYLRHGRHVPPARHLFLGRPALRARRQGPGDVLPRGQEGPDPRGRHQRSRRHVLLHRRRHLLQQPQPADAAVLHLLLDVRPAARRRPRLGGRRQPDPRLPGRRHFRAHHAERRGPAARGRAQPYPRLGDSQLPHL
ncbi:hypothetical protein FQZ97_309160 [compost metagenome]